jgi:hypothetical protein
MWKNGNGEAAAIVHFTSSLPAFHESSAFFSLLLSLSPTSDLAYSPPLIILALRG